MENGKQVVAMPGAQTTALALRTEDHHELERTAFEPNSVDQALELLGQIQPTGLLPKHIKNPQAGLLCLILGREHGLTMMQSLMHLFVVPGGFPQMSVELLVAKVRASGVCAAFHAKEFTDEKVTVYGKRKDTGEEMSSTWTIATATKAGLMGKDNWRHYPRRMLYARAAGDVIKALFQDVTIGLVSREEMLDDPNVIDISPTPTPDATPAPSSPIEALKSIARAGAAMPPPTPEMLPKPEKKTEEPKPNSPTDVGFTNPTTTAPEPVRPPSEPPPTSKPEQEPALSSAELTEEQHAKNRERFAGIVQEFTKIVGDRKRAQELWSGRVPGVAGVKSLKGVTTHKSWAERFEQGNAMLELGKLDVEIKRARVEILDKLGAINGTQKIRDVAGNAESAFAIGADKAHEVLWKLRDAIDAMNKPADAVVVPDEPDVDDLFPDEAEAREPGADG